MPGMIMVKSAKEENLLIELVKEFASRVYLPRNFQPNDTYKKFMKDGIYGISGVEEDKETGESIYQIELSYTYVNFIDFMILKKRSEG